MFSSQLRKTLYTKYIYIHIYNPNMRMQDLWTKRNIIAILHIIFSQYSILLNTTTRKLNRKSEYPFRNHYITLDTYVNTFTNTHKYIHHMTIRSTVFQHSSVSIRKPNYLKSENYNQTLNESQWKTWQSVGFSYCTILSSWIMLMFSHILVYKRNIH